MVILGLVFFQIRLAVVQMVEMCGGVEAAIVTRTLATHQPGHTITESNGYSIMPLCMGENQIHVMNDVNGYS